MLGSLNVDAWRDTLLARQAGAASSPWASDADRVDLIASLERLKRAAEAAQADLAVELDASQRAEQAAAGVPAARRGIGVAHQVALARGVSPHRGRALLGLARALRTELPCTREALRAGVIEEHAAMLVASETAVLDPEKRIAVDRQVLGDLDALAGASTRQLVVETRKAVEQVDVAAVVRRASHARGDRHMSVRPAPDTMAWLTALLPVEQAVSAYASLKVAADTAIGAGANADPSTGRPRRRGQLMADLLVERLTGQARADAVDVEVDVVISDTSLLGAGHEPATVGVPGVAPQLVPAQIAREIIARSLDDAAHAYVRRLYADPDGHLVALTSRQRFFCEGLAAYLRLRDQGICRTPFCDAPIRHLDHVAGLGQGTTADAGQGLCEACNQAKEALGWRHRTIPPEESDAGRHAVETTTPTGHRHRSTAPPLATPARDPARSRPVEVVEHVLPARLDLYLSSDYRRAG